jgi:AcrR family transcriptional regulator
MIPANDTEKAIINAAQKVFILKGYSGTTMDEIACLAKVNKAALHYYFRSKEKIYAIVIMNNLELLSVSLNKKKIG